MAGGASSWKEEAVKRILTVKKLRGDCMKYIRSGEESLANQLLTALLKASSAANEPVKLANIAESVYGSGYREKLDVVRLTMDKTLIRCGIADKIYYSDRDVRYFPVAYRFQEVSRVETGSGAKIEQLVGEAVALPQEYWPVPGDYFELVASVGAAKDALAKLEDDHGRDMVDQATYQREKGGLEDELEALAKKLKQYSEVSEALG